MDWNFFMPGIIRETSSGTERRCIRDEMFRKREIDCAGELTKEHIHALIMQIRYLAQEEPGKEITMYIDCPGGELSGGLALYDVMRASGCGIRTVCMGMAASMGALLFAAGDRRDILPHARVMIHDPLLAAGIGGSALKVDNISRELMRQREVYGSILAEHSGKSLEEIYEKTVRDCYFNAGEAVGFGLADRIIYEL